MQLARQTRNADSSPQIGHVRPELAPIRTPTAALADRVVYIMARDQRMRKRGVSQSVSVSETLMNRGVPRSRSRPSTRWRPGLRPESLGSQSETQRDRTCLTDRDTPRLVTTYSDNTRVDPSISSTLA